MITLIDNLQTMFQTATAEDETLEYIDSVNVYKFENEHDLIKKGIHPFINLHGGDETIQKSKTFKFRDAREKIFKVEISFYTASKTYSTVYDGDANTKGIWTIKNDIWSVIMSDKTVLGYVRDIDSNVSIKSYSTRLKDGIYYAKGTIELSFIKDEFTA